MIKFIALDFSIHYYYPSSRLPTIIFNKTNFCNEKDLKEIEDLLKINPKFMNFFVDFLYIGSQSMLFLKKLGFYEDFKAYLSQNSDQPLEIFTALEKTFDKHGNITKEQ